MEQWLCTIKYIHTHISPSISLHPPLAVIVGIVCSILQLTIHVLVRNFEVTLTITLTLTLTLTHTLH